MEQQILMGFYDVISLNHGMISSLDNALFDHVLLGMNDFKLEVLTWDTLTWDTC
ncbi:hypothetical protein NOR_01809 [Metarhizium rileyi]|uniref:Uncharacterized protein n=1 Tax=Metarhizium rileyi (strain RCEF 4871) TaxID=1649241 RepID=A0A167I197_METRR|nr:hypothetical protein NOR_01809 [Metarhizium rileyi RCEF 4871]